MKSFAKIKRNYEFESQLNSIFFEVDETQSHVLGGLCNIYFNFLRDLVKKVIKGISMSFLPLSAQMQ